jgi:hypothetical protein
MLFYGAKIKKKKENSNRNDEIFFGVFFTFVNKTCRNLTHPIKNLEKRIPRDSYEFVCKVISFL